MIDTNIRIAHRGITSKLAPENSITAFKNAVENRVAIELDVHLTRDKKLVVFHDYTLLRMCKKLRLIEVTKYKKLAKSKLQKTTENMPLLAEVLHMVKGKVPIFIELKTLFNCKKLCNYLTELLDEYRGQVVVFGFNSKAIKYIKAKRNYTVMVSCFKPKFVFKGFVPDGICCNINALKGYKVAKNMPKIVSWTIRTEEGKRLAESFGGYLENIKMTD